MQSAELKFNVFFLLPLAESFPPTLRRTLEAAYEAAAAAAAAGDGAGTSPAVLGGGAECVWDVSGLRHALLGQQAALEAELKQVCLVAGEHGSFPAYPASCCKLLMRG